MPNVTVFLDDIIIKGETIQDIIKNTTEVLDKLAECGLKLKKTKCEFFQEEVSYLGVRIDKNGVHTLKNKVEAIRKAPRPTNRKELQAFLGMINYYDKFIEDRATKFKPIYECLKKERFHWTGACQQAFEKAKEELRSTKVLINFDPEKEVILTCDASDYGLSAILSHATPEGDRPIAYASKALSTSELNYSPIDKEARAIIFGVTKYYDYLYAREFTLRTDHQPVVRILGKKKGIPIMAARRLQRYADFLNAFEYNIEYVKSKENCADGLSRLPMEHRKSTNKEFTYLNYVEQKSFSCLDNKVIAKETRKDKLLSRILLYIRNGWPKRGVIESDVRAFETRKDELYIEQDCIMWGYRVIIPSRLKTVILKELHASHAGIVKMKTIARSFFWWPGIDKEIENVGITCRSCIEVKDNPIRSEVNPWKWPDKPWQRVHTDFIGPYKGHEFLLLIDAKSKWPEVFVMKSTTAAKTVDVFRKVFSRFGFPLQIVSDNGPQYTSETFTSFLKKLGIKHTCTAVKHPASNGAAENFVKTFKRKIKILLKKNKPLQAAIDTILSNNKALHNRRDAGKIDVRPRD